MHHGIWNYLQKLTRSSIKLYLKGLPTKFILSQINSSRIIIVGSTTISSHLQDMTMLAVVRSTAIASISGYYSNSWILWIASIKDNCRSVEKDIPEAKMGIRIPRTSIESTARVLFVKKSGAIYYQVTTIKTTDDNVRD